MRENYHGIRSWHSLLKDHLKTTVNVKQTLLSALWEPCLFSSQIEINGRSVSWSLISTLTSDRLTCSSFYLKALLLLEQIKIKWLGLWIVLIWWLLFLHRRDACDDSRGCHLNHLRLIAASLGELQFMFSYTGETLQCFKDEQKQSQWHQLFRSCTIRRSWMKWDVSNNFPHHRFIWLYTWSVHERRRRRRRGWCGLFLFYGEHRLINPVSHEHL